MTFRKGQSGNPAGRAKGCAQKFLQSRAAAAEAEILGASRRAREGGHGGHQVRPRPPLAPRRDQVIGFRCKTRLCRECDKGKAASPQPLRPALSPEEGATMAKIIEGYVRISEKVDLEKRVEALEQRMLEASGDDE